MLIHGWGRYPVIDAQVKSPPTNALVSAAIAKCIGSSMIPRGMGRSYGDSALAQNIISTSSLNLLLDFDPCTGVVRCGSGVTLAQLLEIFVPKGWFLPVTPGTKFVSVGGAIASDVHGKNHHLDGCFSEYVEHFNLMLPTGEIVRCSKDENSDLFHATCGGMGLTGIIVDVTLKLKPICSSYIEQVTYKAGDLDEALALFSTHYSSVYSVAWIDCLAKGAAMGRSLVMLGKHSEVGALSNQKKRMISIPINMPACLLNRLSIKTFNTLYFHRVQSAPTCELVHYEPFFYPLDRIHHWNRLYGKQGFIQYQFVLPKATGSDGMKAILRKITASGRGSFLAVLKAFGKQNNNLLSFPLEGYTLALDFKLEHGLFRLLEELDAMVLDYGGRLYLTKDSRMSEKTFKQSYPRWEEFQNIRMKYGVQTKFASQQSKRLGLN